MMIAVGRESGVVASTVAGDRLAAYPRTEQGRRIGSAGAGSTAGRMADALAQRGAETESEGVLRRVAAGEPGAVQACLDRFGGLVWSLARRLSSGDADAEDAVQEIFLDVWKSSHRYDPGVASETAFVAMIARRRLIDRRRRASRRPDEHLLNEGAAVGDWDGRADPVELSDEAARAADALGQLSEEQQRVLKLSIYHGLSHEKISRATGLPLGTVKTHARRGLMRIRDVLNGEQSDRASAGTGGAS